MKKAYSTKNNTFLFAGLLFLMLFSCVIFFSTIDIKNVAYAYSAPTVSSVTAVVDYGVNASGEVTLSRGSYDGTSYAKNVEITFDLGGADYYRVDHIVGTTVIEGTEMPAESSTLVYPVTVEGILTVRVTTFDDIHTYIGETEQAVKCDNVSPSASGTSMTEWLPVGATYTARFDTETFEDNLNTLGRVYYRVNDGEIKQADTDSRYFFVPVTDNSIVTVYWFDPAGNCYVDVSNLNRFDNVPPPAPTVTVTPNVDVSTTNGFAKFYTVSIDFHSDVGSGLKANQYYLLNNEQYQYLGPFNIDTARSHEIKATGVDNVNNQSVTTTENISVDTFDVTEPASADFTLDIDVRRDNMCIATVTVADGQSGVKSVYLEDGATFNYVEANVFRAYIDLLNNRSSVLVTEDKVGNVGRKVVLADFASDGAYYSSKISVYASKYDGIDFSEYTEGAKTEIDNAFVAFNTVVLGLIIGGDFDRIDFDNACARIDNAIVADNSTFVISKAATYFTGMLTYEIDYSDFADYKKGEEVKLVFEETGIDNSFVNKSGFSKGFCDAFTLKLYRNGTEVTDVLSKGVKIALAMPAGYYERKYAVFFGEEKLETECVNNKIEFTMKQGGTYNVVVSGDKTARGAEDGKKYITVFGHKLSYPVFFGTVFGVAGGAIVVVVILIIVSRKAKRREY